MSEGIQSVRGREGKYEENPLMMCSTIWSAGRVKG